jgi:TolA-binding protein
MKKLLMIGALSASLFSCSLLQRHLGEEETEVKESEAAENADQPLFDANGQEIGSSVTSSNSSGSSAGSAGHDSEVARLNTKIAALETKVEVLNSQLEKAQAIRSQPIIEAEPRPQANMAAPVDMGEDIQEQAPHISAAPAKPLPVMIRSLEPSSASASGAEKDFRSSMQLFQNNRYLEAASKFALMAKKFPNHLLAGHALYWAGESSARGGQQGTAAENWLELEKHYPRSAYLPEALAGLAKAYEAQGDTAKAKHYRSLVLNSFSKSPVALKMAPEEKGSGQAAMRVARPHAAAPAAASAEEEQAPMFENNDDGGSTDVENQ